VREDIPKIKKLVAYLVVNEDSFNLSNLRNILKMKIPAYMIPSIFVVLKLLPLTANCKVDKKALPDPSFYGNSR